MAGTNENITLNEAFEELIKAQKNSKIGLTKRGEGKNSIVINDSGSRSLGNISYASGYLTLAGVTGWTIVAYTKNSNKITINDPEEILFNLLEDSRDIYYNVRLGVSHYEMWGTIVDWTMDGTELTITISNPIPEDYIGEASPDRNTIIVYTPFLPEEIDDDLSPEEVIIAIKNSLTYKLLTSGPVSIGECNSAAGYLSFAFKMMSHAEGYLTKAMGRYSHAEGRDTISGYSAHAEGYGAQALGLQSHAEGYYTLAKNYAAHAEGDQTEALGHGSHAEGMLYGGDNTKKTKATANGAHAEGQGTVANGMGSHAEGGLTQTGGEYGEKTYGGGFAHAEGFETKALMARSHAEGEGTKTFGQASHAEGGNTTANGIYSHAEGLGTVATGEGAHAEGRSTQTDGSGAHAEGSGTKAFGHSAHAEGFGSATGTGQIADNGTQDKGFFAHAEGVGTQAEGAGSHAEGRLTVASGNYSHAEGYDVTASGKGSHSEGYITQAIGIGAHAEGGQTIAEGNYSHAEGMLTDVHAATYRRTIKIDETTSYTATHKANTAAHLEGYNTTACGECSHSEGIGTIAYGQGAHAEGLLTQAIGAYSHTAGVGTTAVAEAQTVVGKYNAEDNTSLFIVGSGTGDATNKRANAFTAGNDGTDDYITVGAEKLTESELKSIKDGFGDIEQALDVILAIQEELLPHIIEFIIQDTPTDLTLQAIDGMTWSEWCESEYNTVGFSIIDGRPSREKNTWLQYIDDEAILRECKDSDTILPDTRYHIGWV